MSYDADGRLIAKGLALMEYNLTSMSMREGVFSKALHVNPYGERQSTRNTINAKELYSQSITSRDLSGRILFMSEKIGTRIIRHSYRYDTMGRLVYAKTLSGRPFMIPYDGLVISGLRDKEERIEGYRYDSEGNRIEHNTTVNGVTATQTATFYFNALERLDTTFYTYDDDGYLQSRSTPEGTATYSYGARGALRGVILEDGTAIGEQLQWKPIPSYM